MKWLNSHRGRERLDARGEDTCRLLYDEPPLCFGSPAAHSMRGAALERRDFLQGLVQLLVADIIETTLQHLQPTKTGGQRRGRAGSKRQAPETRNESS